MRRRRRRRVVHRNGRGAHRAGGQGLPVPLEQRRSRHGRRRRGDSRPRRQPQRLRRARHERRARRDGRLRHLGVHRRRPGWTCRTRVCQVGMVRRAACGRPPRFCAGRVGGGQARRLVSLIFEGWVPHDPGFEAGLRCLGSGVAGVRAAHSCIARAGDRRPSHGAVAQKACAAGYAVAAAQMKPLSSRAAATVATLPGLPRSRRRVWVR